MFQTLAGYGMVVQYCGGSEFYFNPTGEVKNEGLSENLVVCQVCVTLPWGAAQADTVCIVCTCVCKYMHTGTSCSTSVQPWIGKLARCLWMKGHFSSGYSFHLASTASSLRGENWTSLLCPCFSLVKEQLKVEADKDRGWWRGPCAPAPYCCCQAPGPQSAASLWRAADASSLSGDTGQRRMLDLHVF